jgi:GrpB-like predicted nucleotidyltransferase (UPF0157 family)
MRRTRAFPSTTFLVGDRTERTHLVHVVEHLGRSWRTGLALRDSFRNDPELRARYVEEKERAVAAAPDGRARYNQIKGPYLEIIKATWTASTDTMVRATASWTAKTSSSLWS